MGLDGLIVQKGAKKGQILSTPKYVNMGVKLYLLSARNKNIAIEMLKF